MGGWCGRRSSCPHHAEPTNRVNPAERLCDHAHDGWVDGQPIRVYREAGSWELGAVPSMLRPAEPFDGLAA